MAILEPILDRLRAHAFPGIIYHYTSADGLLGMVDRSAIWATDVRYLNDSQEYHHARKMALECFEAFWKARGTSANADAEREFTLAMSAARASRTFVASFSAEGDLLSQWRAYCPPNGGFTVGFAPQPLAHITRSALFPCIYDVSVQRDLMGRLIEGWYDAFERHWPSIVAPDRGNVRRQGRLTDALFALAAVSKHPGFSEEREWRLVTRSDVLLESSLKFRSGRSGLVPYVELPLSGPGYPIKLRKMIVGPNAHQRLAYSAAKGLLSKARWMYDRIEISNTPYRSC